MGVSAVKAGLGRIAQSPSAPWAVQAEACALTANASVTVIIVGKIVQRPVAQLTAALEDSVWMENASAKKALQERTAVN